MLFNRGASNMMTDFHVSIRVAIMALGINVCFAPDTHASEVHDAARDGLLVKVEKIIEGHPDIDVRDKNERTPLMIAAARGHTEIVRLLLSKNANATAATDGGTTVLMYAAFGKEPKAAATIAGMLLERGADPNASDRDNQTPLMIFSTAGNTDGITLLLDHGAKINAQDSTGHTALMAAAVNGRVDAVRLLLKNGANTSIRAADGKTARDYAVHNQEGESTELLNRRKQVADLFK